MNDETFTPENVDEQIDQQLFLLWKDQARQPSASVVRGLHALYEEDVRSTAHVWERLVRQVGERHLAAQDTEHFNALPQQRDLPLPQVPRGANASRRQKRQSSRTGQTPFGWRVNLLVAVLVMIALVGSLVTVLHEIHPNVPAGTSGVSTTTPSSSPAGNTWGQTLYTTPTNWGFEGLAWSSDSRRVAVLNLDMNRVQIWDATTGGHLINIRLPDVPPSASLMAWSPNGKWLAISDMTGIVMADAQTGAIIHRFLIASLVESLPVPHGSALFSLLQPASGGFPGVSGLVWSPDSRLLAVTTLSVSAAERHLSILNAQTGALVYRFSDTGSSWITVASWSSDGKYLAAIVGDRSEHLMAWAWDMSTSPYRTAFKQDIGIGDPGVAVWGDRLVWQSHSDNLAFAQGQLGRSSGIVLWDVVHNKLLKRYSIPNNSMLALSPDGKYLATGGDVANQVVILDMQSGQQIYVYRQQQYIGFLAWSPDGKYIASCSGGGVKVWIAP